MRRGRLAGSPGAGQLGTGSRSMTLSGQTLRGLAVSPASARPVGTRFGELTGNDLLFAEGRVTLRHRIRTHPDRSATYLAEADNKKHVARVFEKRPAVEEQKLRAANIPASRGLTRYDHVGQVLVEPNDGKAHGRAWATIRPYAGHTLADVLDSKRVEGQYRSAVHVVVDMAFGLQALHRSGVTHGDLRPSNVILGDGEDARLVDYGVPLRLGSTIPSSVVGYIAPEQLYSGVPRGAGDIYSFGKLVRAVLKVSSPGDRSDRELLSWIVSECLNTAPAKRPSIEGLLDLLEDVNVRKPARFRNLRQAILADLDGRIPDLIQRHPKLVSRAALSAAMHLEHDVAKYRAAYRITSLTQAEQIHLLSTLALGLLPFRPETSSARPNYVIINAVEREQSSASDSIVGSSKDLDFAPLDKEWEEELTIVALGGARMDEAKPNQLARVRRKLQYAAELRASVLSSDRFVRSKDVVALMADSCPGITVDEVHVLREMGYLLSLPDNGTNLYPLSQFELPTGLPYKCIKEVSDLTYGTGSLWRRSVWWFLETPRLGNVSPLRWLESGGRESEVVSMFSERYVA